MYGVQKWNVYAAVGHPSPFHLMQTQNVRHTGLSKNDTWGFFYFG